MPSSISTTTSDPSATDARLLEESVATVGQALSVHLNAVLGALPDGPFGPAELARVLSLDKVLTSRVLKAVQNRDPMAVLYLIPGPEPLRRLLKAAGRRKVPATLVAGAEGAVAAFETLIRRETGDRSALDAIISAWLPEARAEFELRRKQAAYRAMSQLKGSTTTVNISSAILHPADDGEHLDIVWIFGLLGLQRLRPGGAVKLASRRLTVGDQPRQPHTLAGEPVGGIDGLMLRDFSSDPPPRLNVHQINEIVHYTLAEETFGPRSAKDLVFAEVNLAELPRWSEPDTDRRRYVFCEVSPPTKTLVFDTLLADGVFAEQTPQLQVYDTAFEGVADPNDPTRALDQLDLTEKLEPLGTGIRSFRTTEVPFYVDLLEHVCDALGWDSSRLTGYRSRIDYPLYGSQVVMSFPPVYREG